MVVGLHFAAWVELFLPFPPPFGTVHADLSTEFAALSTGQPSGGPMRTVNGSMAPLEWAFFALDREFSVWYAACIQGRSVHQGGTMPIPSPVTRRPIRRLAWALLLGGGISLAFGAGG